MALPTIDECTCSCHGVSSRQYVMHGGQCCTGQSLAWGAWGAEDVMESVAQGVTFSEEEKD